MSATTGIEWTDATWNPVTGCTKVSPGCDHCYAETFAERWRGTPGHYYENGFDVQLRPDKLELPLSWRKPKRVFVNSMSDLFHDSVPDEYIARVFAVMALAERHTFQVLTKRHARMRSLLRSDAFWKAADISRSSGVARLDAAGNPTLTNIWLGVSAENQQWADIRIPALLDTPAAVRFVSAEPLLGHIEFEFENHYAPDHSNCSGLVSPAHEPACGREPGRHWGIDWVIVGGESGRGARPMHPQWARDIRDQCQNAGVAFLFKQWGEWGPWYSNGEGEDGPGDAFVNLDSSTGHVWFNEDLGYPTNWSGNWNADSSCVSRVGKKAAGRELDGRTWDQYPEAVTV